MEIKITKTTAPKEKPDSSTLGFGKIFTDHMFVMDYSADKGWHDARIIPFENISLHPAATVLHYGSEIFEGLKAYRRADGRVQLFRPIENIRRMNNSAERLCRRFPRGTRSKFWIPLSESSRTGLRRLREPPFISVPLCSETMKI